MKSPGLTFLIAVFALSTVTLSADDGDPCDNQCCTDAPCPGEDHPEAPPSDAQDHHCCCTHTQALSTVTSPEGFTLCTIGWVASLPHPPPFAPSLRETFHIPIA